MVGNKHRRLIRRIGRVHPSLLQRQLEELAGKRARREAEYGGFSHKLRCRLRRLNHVAGLRWISIGGPVSSPAEAANVIRVREYIV